MKIYALAVLAFVALPSRAELVQLPNTTVMRDHRVYFVMVDGETTPRQVELYASYNPNVKGYITFDVIEKDDYVNLDSGSIGTSALVSGNSPWISDLSPVPGLNASPVLNQGLQEVVLNYTVLGVTGVWRLPYQVDYSNQSAWQSFPQYADYSIEVPLYQQAAVIAGWVISAALFSALVWKTVRWIQYTGRQA